MVIQKNKIKIFALGNPLLGDASIGLLIGYQLEKALNKCPVDIFIEEDSKFHIDSEFENDDFIIIIKGLPSYKKVGTLTQFNLHHDTYNKFSKEYNINEIPGDLQKILNKNIGEIIVININNVNWTTELSEELFSKFEYLTDVLSRRIKTYSLAYI